tara:strand:+ start:1652 stop:1903 length:252 start_codon:yes stop_codon:yes gene_type:complete
MIEKYLDIFEKELKINKALREKLIKKKDDIQLNNFKNWDSMKHVRILISIEKKFKIKINEKNENYFNNFQSGLKYLKKFNSKL